MRIFSAIFASLLAQGMSVTGAHAWDLNPYIGVSYNVVDIEAKELIGVSPKNHSASTQVGISLTPYFGLEAEWGNVSEPVGETVNGVDISVDITKAIGLYANATLPLTERLSVYGRAGGITAATETTFTAPGVGRLEVDDNLDGYSVGVGTTYDLTKRIALRGFYTRAEFSNAATNTFSLGSIWRF